MEEGKNISAETIQEVVQKIMDSVKINTKSQDALLKLNQKYITARGKIYLLSAIEKPATHGMLKTQHRS
nr:MAG TPA: hypothetical protein [Caudoviricetes sp.]